MKKKCFFVYVLIHLLFFSGCDIEKNDNGDNGNKNQTDIYVPYLNDISIGSYGADYVTLSKPTFLNSNNNMIYVQAYIGEDGLITISGDTVNKYLEGTIDVSSSDHTFKNLSPDKNYRIIVIAKNNIGYSTRQVVYALGNLNAIKEDVEILRNTPATDFLTNGDNNTDRVTRCLNLPTSGSNGTKISWKSSKPDVITSDGIITRYYDSMQVSLEATVTRNNIMIDNNTVSFSFTVYRMLFYEDFEDNYDNWNIESSLASPQVLITDKNFAKGHKALTIDLSNVSGGYCNLVGTLSSDIQPEYIGAYIMLTEENINSTVNIAISKNNDSAIGIFFDGRDNTIYTFGKRNNCGRFYANRWYHIEFKNINWGSKAYDLYIDDNRIGNIGFWDYISSMNSIILEGQEYSRVYWDDIFIW